MKRKWILALFIPVIMAALLVASCDKLITETNEVTITGYPKASFLVDADSCCLPCTIQFFDDSDGPHQNWLWDFGDGDSALIADPTHGYAQAGFYTVSLVITDASNGNDDREIRLNYIEVKDTLHPTTAQLAVSPLTGTLADTFSFTATALGVADSWLWDFGDSTTSNAKNTTTHVYTVTGTFEIRLTVTNECDSIDVIDTLIVN